MTINDKSTENKVLNKALKPALNLNDVNALNPDNLDNKYLKMCNYLNSRYDIYYNIVKNEFRYKLKKSNNLLETNVAIEYELENELLLKGFKNVSKNLYVYLQNNSKRVDPFAFYFESLPTWSDGIDHISLLANHVETTKQDFFLLMFKKHLVRTVAQSLGKTVNKQCFTLVGPQNNGKTTFLRKLVPPPLKEYYKENFDLSSKDGRIALCQNFILNMDELQSLRKMEVNTFKTILSLESVKERHPYQKTPIEMKRSASFFGSTNDSQFLTDTTGNVRFLVFDIKNIKFDYSKIDINDVWSQAYTLYKRGFDYNLTKDEIKLSESENNEKYLILSNEIELIQKHFIQSDANNITTEFMNATDIQSYLQAVSGLKLIANQIGKALSYLKFNQIKKYDPKTKYTRHGYFVQKLQ